MPKHNRKPSKRYNSSMEVVRLSDLSDAERREVVRRDGELLGYKGMDQYSSSPERTNKQIKSGRAELRQAIFDTVQNRKRKKK